MALTPTNVLDNSMTPGIAAEIFKPDQLIAGPFQPVSEQITVLSGQGVIARGTVLGKVTAGGALKIYDPAAEDGTEDVFAILFEGGVSGDERTIISRVAEVKASKLVWFAGATANQIATGVAALEALGIVVR